MKQEKPIAIIGQQIVFNMNSKQINVGQKSEREIQSRIGKYNGESHTVSLFLSTMS